MSRRSQLLGSAEQFSPLSVENLTVNFGDLPPIVSNVSFDLEAREILFVRGPSGAGKSRLLRAIAALDHTNTGTVTHLGVAPHTLGLPAWRRSICYVSDSPPPLTTSAEDAFQRVLNFSSQRERWQHVADTPQDPPSLAGFRETAALLAVDLAVLKRPIHSLSAGERQRVALAWALALQPAVLLLDEPTSHLDAVTTGRFEHLVRQRRFTALWISHDDAQIKRLGGRVLQIPDGNIYPASELDSVPPSKNASSGVLVA